MRSAAVLLALAQPAAGLEGPWCMMDGDSGARMWIDVDQGVWFNENTLCEAEPLPRFEADHWQAELACRSIYVIDMQADGTVETEEIPRPEFSSIAIARLTQTTLRVTLPPEPPFDMIHCAALWPN